MGSGEHSAVESRKFEVIGTRFLFRIISSFNYREVDIKNVEPPKMIIFIFLIKHKF